MQEEKEEKKEQKAETEVTKKEIETNPAGGRETGEGATRGSNALMTGSCGVRRGVIWTFQPPLTTLAPIKKIKKT